MSISITASRECSMFVSTAPSIQIYIFFVLVLTVKLYYQHVRAIVNWRALAPATINIQIEIDLSPFTYFPFSTMDRLRTLSRTTYSAVQESLDSSVVFSTLSYSSKPLVCPFVDRSIVATIPFHSIYIKYPI